MKFSGKMCLKIVLKVTKNQGFTLSVEDKFFEKTTGGVKLTLPPAVLGLSFSQARILNYNVLDNTLIMLGVNHCSHSLLLILTEFEIIPPEILSFLMI